MVVCGVRSDGYAIAMVKEVRLWQVGNGDHLTEIRDVKLDLESRLEEWLVRDISVLDPGLLLIGRQVATDGGPLDLLCLNERGDLVIVELKRDKTPREITAQVLDYASCVVDLPNEKVRSIAESYLNAGLDDVFKENSALRFRRH